MFELTGYWSLLYQIPVGLLGLSFLIFIHEGGHFLAAKWAGVKVNTFSIGFGKKLLKWKKGETEYCISAIPFGGYVAMAGEQPNESTSPSNRDFRVQSIPKRMVIALAGPVVNIAFAFLALFFLYMYGVQEPIYSMKVGAVEKESPAAEAGIQRGDEIVAFDGEPVDTWESFHQNVAIKGERPADVTVLRDGEKKTLEMKAEIHPEWGLAISGVVGESDVTVMKLIDGKPAARAGIREGETIVSVDGVRIGSASMLVQRINKSEGQPVNITLRENGQTREVKLTPELDEGTGRYIVGLYPGTIIPTKLVEYGFVESLGKSFDKNVEFGSAVFKTIQGIATGHIKAKALSGPLGILQMIATGLHRSIQQFIQFMSLISLNLGLINLLPLAITDGGIILFLMLEAIRKKPLKVSTQIRINQVAVTFFLLLALFVTFHDIKRISWFLN